MANIPLSPYNLTFLADQTGAVTVDWVVLTAALSGLGLATLAVVSGGIENLAEDSATQLASLEVGIEFGELGQLLSLGFSGGVGPFSGGTLITAAGFGDILQIGQNEIVEASFDIPAGAGEATVSFDLIGADDFDGDTATILINGQAVSVYTDNQGIISVNTADLPGVEVSVTQHYTDANLGGGSLGDSRATYQITVTDPGTDLTLGVQSQQSAGVSNEYFALDDVSVDAR